MHACVMIPRGIKMNLYMEFMNRFMLDYEAHLFMVNSEAYLFTVINQQYSNYALRIFTCHNHLIRKQCVV